MQERLEVLEEAYSAKDQIDILTVRRRSQLLRMSELDEGET
ncbi:hypothetical protein [Marinobacter sp. Arc7-DN-1]|nr:hypothetical protein [Marinobacter sp. Arc7-DN-1]